MRFMDVAGVCDSIEAVQAIGNDSGSRIEISFAPMLDFVVVEALCFRKEAIFFFENKHA
jgi:hypothetical protein